MAVRMDNGLFATALLQKAGCLRYVLIDPRGRTEPRRSPPASGVPIAEGKRHRSRSAIDRDDDIGTESTANAAQDLRSVPADPKTIARV